MKAISSEGRTFDVFHVGFEDPPEWMLGLHAIKRLQMDFANEFCTSVELLDEDLEEHKAKYGDYVLADDACNLRVCSEEDLHRQYKEVAWHSRRESRIPSKENYAARDYPGAAIARR